LAFDKQADALAADPSQQYFSAGLIEPSFLLVGNYIVVWWLAPHIDNGIVSLILTSAFLAVILYTVIISPVYIHKHDLQSRGLGPPSTFFIRTDNLMEGAKIFAGNVFILSILILLAAWWKRPDVFLSLDWGALSLKFLIYFFSSLLQNLIFISYAFNIVYYSLPLTARIPHRVQTVVVIASLFSLFHLPNWPMMILTMIIGTVFTWHYYIHRNLFLMVCSQAIIGTLLHRVLEINMRIGPFYWDTDTYVIRKIVPGMAELIGKSF